MPVLGVCGDSFMAPTNNSIHYSEELSDSDGKHHSELIAKHFNYELYPLSRGGCSNAGIRLQIEVMIEKKVDFVLIGTTTQDRIEFRLTEEYFDPKQLIFNVRYEHAPAQSRHDINFGRNQFACENFSSLLEGYHYTEPKYKEKMQAVKDYFTHLYDPEFKKLQDSWIIANAVQELEYHKIPYLIILWPWMRDHSKFLQQDNKRFLDHNYRNSKCIPHLYPTSPRCWHSSDESQIELAQHLCEYIILNNLLHWS
jgi:hypothetical protein